MHNAPFFLQGDMAGLDGGGEKDGSGVGELLCRLGGEVFARAARSDGIADSRMAREIIAERQGNNVALGNGLRLRVKGRQPMVDLRLKQRVMGATEDDGIDQRVLRKQSGQVFIHEIVRSAV